MALTVVGALIGTELSPRYAGTEFPTHCRAAAAASVVAPTAKRRPPVPFQVVAPEAALRDPDTEGRRRAERVLGGVTDDEATAQRVATLLADASPAVRNSAAKTLGAMGQVAVPATRAVVCGPCLFARAAAVEALAYVGAAAVPEVLRLLRSDDPPVVTAAKNILTESVRRVKPEDQKELFAAIGKGGLDVVKHFCPLLSDNDRQMRQRASKVLSCTGPVGAEIVADVLRSTDPQAQHGASRVLLGIGSKAVAHVANLHDAHDEELRGRASAVLQQLAKTGSPSAESALVRINTAIECQAEKAKVDISALSSEKLVSIVTAQHTDGPSRRQAAAQLRERGSSVAPLLRQSLETTNGYARWFGERTLLSMEQHVTEGNSSTTSNVYTVPQESVTLAGVAPSIEAAFAHLADRYGHHPTPEAFAAAQVLQGQEFGKWAIERIVALLSDADERVREAASNALRLVVGELTSQRQHGSSASITDNLHLTGESWWAALANTLDVTIDPADKRALRLGWFEYSKVEVHATPAHRTSNAQLLGTVGHAATSAGSGRDAVKSARRLVVMLQDVDPGVRRTALHSLKEASGGVYRSTHAEAVALRLQDSDEGVRAAAAMALADMGSEGEGHAAWVATLLRDRFPVVRHSAVVALGRMASVRGAAQAAVYLKDNLPEVRQSAAEALNAIGIVAEAHVHEVVDLLTDKVGAVRETAKKALPRMGPASGKYVAALVAHPEAHVRALAVQVLGSLHGSGKDEAATFLGHRDAQVRAAAIAALGAIGSLAQEYAGAVSVALDDKYGPGGQQRRWQERLEACRALGRMGAGAVSQAPKLATCLRDREADVRIAAVDSLAQLLVTDDKRWHDSCLAAVSDTADIQNI